MYIDKDVSVTFDQRPPYPRYFTTDEKIEGDLMHRYGYIEMPIFPLDKVPFVHEIKLRLKEKREVRIYYYFRTDLGDSPIWSWIAMSRGKYTWLKCLKVS